MKKVIALAMSSLWIIIAGSAHALVESPAELNKKTVVAFYEEAINQKNFEGALKYIGSHYTQHNPLAADGTEGLKTYIQYLREHYPNSHNAIKRVFAEGDYVILHVHKQLEPDTRGYAIMDLFKLENGKIVEHWDVIQEVPEKSANDNGMF